MLGAAKETELRVKMATIQGLRQRLRDLDQQMQDLQNQRDQVMDQLMREVEEYLDQQRF